MIEFKFKDSSLPKYISVGDFHCGRAFVKDRETLLYGFIDTSGKEIIRCRYRDVEDFSENLAVVKTESGYGYIDTFGDMHIAPTFLDARPFSSGLALVQNFDKRWNYIDKDGTTIIGELSKEGLPCTENKACFYRSDGENLIYDHQSIKSVPFYWFSSFSEGFAIAKDREQFLIIDENLTVLHRMSTSAIQEIGPSKDGLFRLVSLSGRVGYLNHRFEIQIPFMYKDGKDFNNGYALVKLFDEVLGYINTEGIATAFMKNLQYTSIDDFYENRAKVSSKRGVGFIDGTGKEKIPCKKARYSHFSEGLVACYDGMNFTFVDPSGEVKIVLPSVFYSNMTYLDKCKVLKADSTDDLYKEKIAALKTAKNEIMLELESDIRSAEKHEYQKIR